MNLSYKATQFIIEAIEYQMKAYQERLDMDNLDEDEASDLGNDYWFLDALRTDLVKSLDKWVSPKVLQSDEQISEPAFDGATQTTMQIPTDLVPVVQELITKHQA